MKEKNNFFCHIKEYEMKVDSGLPLVLYEMLPCSNFLYSSQYIGYENNHHFCLSFQCS